MEVYLLIIIFILGTLFGSFFNVVGYRLPKGLSIVYPGSFCPKCNHKLKWYELIPIFSFLIQKGKCRKCKCRISLFYPGIELLTGVLFVISYLVFNLTPEFLIAILVSSFFVIVIVSDFNYLIIPDEITLFFSTSIIIVDFIFYNAITCFQAVFRGIILFATMYLIMLLGNKIFKKESLGGGDIKLMFFVGTVLPICNGFFSIFFSSVLALPISIFNYVKNKNKVIPFGPFILLATIVILFSKIDFFKLLSNITS